jgi:Protein of unknwon function (DUF3008)
MNTQDFNKPITAYQLNENMHKQFGTKINLEAYNREDLENYRNLIRTKISQTEANSKFNDLLTNETYQRDQYVLKILNTRIKEMLGESIKVMEKAVSKAQQKAAGVALAAKKSGKTLKGKTASADMEKMPTKELKKFAGTKQKGLPEKKKKTDESIEMITNEGKKKPSAGLTAKEKSATAKSAKAGKDIGKPGKNFEKVASKASKEYGSKAAGDKVAAAAMWKNKAKKIKESVERFIMEDEEGKATAITAGIDMVNDFTSWMQRVGQYQSKTLIELADEIKSNFGAQEAEAFKQAVIPALKQTFDALTTSRETLSNAIDVLAGEENAVTPMGQEPAVGAGEDLTGDEDLSAEPAMDTMNTEPEDEFGASDAAAGGAETAGRERREGKEYRRNRISESHSIMTILSKR